MLNHLWSLFTFHSHIPNWLHASLHVYYIHCKAKKYHVCTKNRRRFMLMSWIAQDWWCKTGNVMMVWRVCFRPKFLLQNSLLSNCPSCRWACLRFTPQCQSACRSKLKASSCAALNLTQTREPPLQSSWRTAFWRAVPGRGQSLSLTTLWKNQPVSL